MILKVVCVHRPSAGHGQHAAVDGHASEQEWKAIPADLNVQNKGSLGELCDTALRFVAPLLGHTD
jgi:hypothetical protein